MLSSLTCFLASVHTCILSAQQASEEQSMVVSPQELNIKLDPALCMNLLCENCTHTMVLQDLKLRVITGESACSHNQPTAPTAY